MTIGQIGHMGQIGRLGVILLGLAALGMGCGIARKYDVRFGLKADMSDDARDPNSVAMLDRSEGTGKRPLRRPAEEILTTEGVDEALDDDMDNINPPEEAAAQEKSKAASEPLGGSPK